MVFGEEISILVSQNAGAWISIEKDIDTIHKGEFSLPNYDFPVNPSSAWCRSDYGNPIIKNQFNGSIIFNGLRYNDLVHILTESRPYQGKLLAREGDFLLIDSDEKIIHIQINTILEISPIDPTISSPLRCTLKNPKKNTKLNYGFSSSSLKWAAEYDFIQKDEKSASLYSYFRLINHHKGQAKNIKLTLISGKIQTAGRNTALYSERFSKMTMASADTRSTPEQSSSKDYYLTTYPDKITLTSHSEDRYTLAKTRDINIITTYNIKGYDSRANKGSAQKNIGFLNGKNETILAAGKINIYNENKLFFGESSIRQYGAGESVEFSAGTAADLRFKRIITDKKRTKNYEDVRIKYLLNNYSKKSKEFVIEDRISGNYTLKDHSHNYEKLDSDVLKFKINIPAGKNVEMTYSYSKVY